MDEVHKFEALEYKLDDCNYFKIISTRLEYNNDLITSCLFKSIEGNINNIKFDYKKIFNNLNLKFYLRNKETVKSINDYSLRINDKKWFNFIDDSELPIGNSELPIISELLDDKHNHFNIPKLLETCIISNENKVENFENIPIYFFNGSIKRDETPILIILELVVDMLIKLFPSFKDKILKSTTINLNKAELTNTTLEDISNLSKEELLELYKKEHQKVEELETKNKSNSLEETEKLYDKYMNESELFRNEVKRYLIETQKQFIDKYVEGDKIKIIDSFKSNTRSTSSIDLGNIGENYVKELVMSTGLLHLRCDLNIINTSKVAHQSELRVIDEKCKIIYLLEVKNKNNIDREDIDKFKRDIENVTKSHKDYTIVPLFLSLN